MSYRLTQEQFIEKCYQAHSDVYDYSKAVYTEYRTKVIIICKIHGEFQQLPAAHYDLKQGCPVCSRIKNNESNTKRKYTIESLSKRILNPNLEITSTEFKNIHSKISVRCKKHNIKTNVLGTSLINPKMGMFCSLCNEESERKIDNRTYYFNNFITKAKEKHGDMYRYDLVEYVNDKTKVKIICTIHGIFHQKPANHISNNPCGCPYCKLSQGESRIQIYLKANSIVHIAQHKVKIGESNHYYDFYLPEHNTIIEFNGLQHYKPIKWFGGVETFKACVERDEIKRKYCQENNIKLIIIHYKDKDQIEETLKHQLQCRHSHL